LGREVRVKDVELGMIKGVVLEGLEVSEKPDFKAGTFAGVERFRFRVQWLPLLRKKVVVDEISVSGPSLRVVQVKSGVFNFSDLVPAPAGAPAAPVQPGSAVRLPFDLQMRKVALTGGSVEYADAVSGAKWRVSGLRAVLKDVSLIRPFGVEAGLDAEQLAPGRLRANMSLDLKLDLGGMASGLIAADIKKLAAEVSGLSLTLAGPVRLDPRRLEAAELKGKLGSGTLRIKASVLEYSTAPDLRLEAELSTFDAAQFLAAAGAAGSAQPAAGAPAKAGVLKPKTAAAAAGPALKTSGKLTVGDIRYHTFKAEALKASWDLRGITPDLRGLAGWAKVETGGGSLDPEGGSGDSRLMKALLIPLSVLKKIGGLGGPLKILPSFDKIVFTDIKGDYVFDQGIMTFQEFYMNSPAAHVRTEGRIDLPRQGLALVVTVALAKLAPVLVDVGGTFGEPQTQLRLSPAAAESMKKLAQPAADLLRGLFKKK
jgi:uncharacterized protein involved in outer membrane biogenesis